ncbi:hypothetical protein FA13DRAFT_1479528 [Coprinellus micaceus]|uniref:Uncharacterized protein n=1 Tax=Coprinellus micaceus TaxID=71717 RepID=A0A4Y7SL66_COPMI|nr:hypothetical protein FA13DRAFT_1479528 [Coprinellus micaceus]
MGELGLVGEVRNRISKVRSANPCAYLGPAQKSHRVPHLPNPCSIGTAHQRHKSHSLTTPRPNHVRTSPPRMNPAISSQGAANIPYENRSKQCTAPFVKLEEPNILSIEHAHRPHFLSSPLSSPLCYPFPVLFAIIAHEPFQLTTHWSWTPDVIPAPRYYDPPILPPIGPKP